MRISDWSSDVCSSDLQTCQARRNEASKLIGQAMAQKDMEKAEALKAEVADLKERMPALETQDRAIGEELQAMLLAIPNLPAEVVPIVTDAIANIELAIWGEPPRLEFQTHDNPYFVAPLRLGLETAT